MLRGVGVSARQPPRFDLGCAGSRVRARPQRIEDALTKRSTALALGLAALALSGCAFDRTPNFAVAPGAAKIPPDYRRKIADWARRTYAEPSSVRLLAIADPVPIRTTEGAALWLVCVEIDANARGGAPMGPRKVAIGFDQARMSAPLERSAIDLRNEDCDARALAWRAWSVPARASRRG